MIDTEKVVGFYTDAFGNEIDEYEQIERYSVRYEGKLFDGDSDGYNERGADNGKMQSPSIMLTPTLFRYATTSMDAHSPMVSGIDERRTNMKFKITIEEMVSQEFEVEAESMEEAMEIAEDNYNSGEFVLEPGELVSKQMMGECEETGESTEWTEF